MEEIQGGKSCNRRADADVDGIRHWPRELIDKLFWLEKDHCKESFVSG